MDESLYNVMRIKYIVSSFWNLRNSDFWNLSSTDGARWRNYDLEMEETCMFECSTHWIVGKVHCNGEDRCELSYVCMGMDM